MSDQDIAVRVEAVRRDFGAVEALRGVDLEIPRGKVFGLLGPNGAGKTTLVRILATLLKPTSGTATVAGFDVVKHPDEVRVRIGLTGQYAAVDEDLTGTENLVMMGRLLGLGRPRARQRAEELLDAFGMSDAGGRSLKTYSGGMRRRLDLAASLVGRPEIVFLDEPTTGLDPRSRLGLWDVVRDLVATGTTVLLTTQYLEEADQLSERIAVIDHGLVIAEGTASELKQRVGGHVVDVTLEPDQVAAARDALDHVADDIKVDRDAPILYVPVPSPGALVDVVRALDKASVEVIGLQMHEPSLDDVFLALTGTKGEGE
jgi:daunorubicin resistance ABC transporter ATP-binding subunit